MEKNEPAYTPRSEYMCRDSDTHYQGCQCHEARWQKRIAELESELNRLRTALEVIEEERCSGGDEGEKCNCLSREDCAEIAREALGVGNEM